MFDYTAVYGVKNENMSAEEYVAMASSSTSLGDPEVQSQHLLGSSKVRKLTPTTATAWRQLRAAHVRIKQNPRQEVALAHAQGALQFIYEKVDASWRISGMRGWGDFMEEDILGVFPSWVGKRNVSWAY